jgi:hypothetical protein
MRIKIRRRTAHADRQYRRIVLRSRRLNLDRAGGCPDSKRSRTLQQPPPINVMAAN